MALPYPKAIGDPAIMSRPAPEPTGDPAHDRDATIAWALAILAAEPRLAACYSGLDTRRLTGLSQEWYGHLVRLRMSAPGWRQVAHAQRPTAGPLLQQASITVPLQPLAALPPDLAYQVQQYTFHRQVVLAIYQLRCHGHPAGERPTTPGLNTWVLVFVLVGIFIMVGVLWLITNG